MTVADYRILSHQQASQYYSSAVDKQDRQSHYEDPPIEWLLEAGRFGDANSVVEFGCGTGRLAKKMLADVLPETATYIGYDISAPMVELTYRRVQEFGNRARVVRTDGDTQFDLPDNSCDRFLSTYVLDLLSTTDNSDRFGDSFIPSSPFTFALRISKCQVSLCFPSRTSPLKRDYLLSKSSE